MSLCEHSSIFRRPTLVCDANSFPAYVLIDVVIFTQLDEGRQWVIYEPMPTFHLANSYSCQLYVGNTTSLPFQPNISVD